jgi:hypothetical protein
MEPLETFKSYVVPELSQALTRRDFCNLSVCEHGRGCSKCLFNHNRPETLEPFNEWMETRKK